MRGRVTIADWRMRKRQRDYAAANGQAKSLRTAMTPVEGDVWAISRNMEGLPGRFRRQAPIGPYIVDFVCHALKVVVEIDGGIHRLREVIERDERRDAWLASEGDVIIRVKNDEARDAVALANRIRRAAPHP